MRQKNRIVLRSKSLTAVQYISVTVFSIRDRGDYRASRPAPTFAKNSLKISSASLRRHLLQRAPPSPLQLQLQCRGESQLQSLTALHYTTRGRLGTNERYVSSVGDLGGLCRWEKIARKTLSYSASSRISLAYPSLLDRRREGCGPAWLSIFNGA